jgi:SnoaL-like domain
MRTPLIGGALAVLVVLLAACGGSSANSAAEQALQRKADLWEIEQIANKWHKALSRHDIDLAMSLWAPRATWTVKSGRTLVGKEQIRRFILTETVAWKNHWVSLATAYKTRATADGDKGTLNFECHYIELKTEQLVRSAGGDLDVARINGRWLITNWVGWSPTLSP